MAAIHFLHEPHRVELSAAHGEDRVGLFFAGDSFRVAEAAAPGTGISQGGFAGVYQGPCVRLGALSADSPPRPGPRADEHAVRESLGELLALAREDAISAGDLRGASHLCLCEAAGRSWVTMVVGSRPGVSSHGGARRLRSPPLRRVHPAPTGTRAA